jgi:hypothetical protein
MMVQGLALSGWGLAMAAAYVLGLHRIERRRELAKQVLKTYGRAVTDEAVQRKVAKMRIPVVLWVVMALLCMAGGLSLIVRAV